MADQTTRVIKVVAHSSDNHAVAVAQQFASNFSGSRRTRRFLPLATNGENGHLGYEGTIAYHPKDQQVLCTIPVEVVITATPNRERDIDWVLLTSARNPTGRFTTNPARILHAVTLPDNYPIVAAPNQLVVYGRLTKEEQRGHQRIAAANHLAAEITARVAYRPGLLNFPGGVNGDHFQYFGRWIADGTPIDLISACCLNCTADRRRIVNQLSPTITNLLVRTAQAAYAGLPINSWQISTFGPNDLELLGEWGIKQVLLPYMWDAPTEQVRADMALNYTLVQGLARQLDAVLPFKVSAHQLFEGVQAVDVSQLTALARERAEKMMPGLMKNPPKIFEQIPSDQWLPRIQQEAFLYLWDTTQHGQIAGIDRPAIICAGLEVHGGYVQGGELFRGPNGEFLPYSWFPNAVRQHWGDWTLTNNELRKDRQRLTAHLKQLGY